jgi:hypothetical protein
MKLDLPVVAIVLTLINVLISFYFNRKKSVVEDEVALTQRISRSQVFEVEVKKHADQSCRDAFSGRGTWVKELAREVFRDQQQIMMNEGTFVDGKTWKEFRGGLGEDITDLKRAIDELRLALANQPKLFKDMLLEIRRSEGGK